MTTQLLLRLLLAPFLVGIASWLMARLGPRLGGLITALPVVTGPILLLFCLEQGPVFAAAAATKTLIGTLALIAYTTSYAHLAKLRRGRSWPWTCLLLGWAAFLICAAGLERVDWPNAWGIPVALAAIGVGFAALPRVETLDRKGAPPSTRWLSIRMGAAAILVGSLAEAAACLGPTRSGLLTAFPVASTVMLVATHLEQGSGVALLWLRGFLVGLLGYVAFVSSIAYLLPNLGVARSFALGLLGAFAVQWLVIRRTGARPMGTQRPKA